MTQTRTQLRTIIATQHVPLAGDNDRFGFGERSGSLRVVDARRSATAGAVIQVGPLFTEHLHTLQGIPAAEYDRLMLLEVANSARLVGPHQRSVARDVGGEHRRQSAENLLIFAGRRHLLAIPSSTAWSA